MIVPGTTGGIVTARSAGQKITDAKGRAVRFAGP